MNTESSDFYFGAEAPERLGLPSASVLELLDTIRTRSINIHSLMILRHGRAAVRLWWKPYAPEHPHQLYSFSKSVLSAAVAMAISEGRLSADDRIARFFPRRIDPDADERIYTVTVEHLLTMTSGAVAQNEVTMRRQTDWVEWFLNTPLSFAPGQRFVYNSLNSYMLAAILRRVTGQGLVEYLMPRLFTPLGIAEPVWDTCPMGIECGGWGLYLTTEDMAKFCQLCLDDGRWQGRRLLPEGWAAIAGSGRVTTDTDSKLSDSPHRTGGYGYHFWRNSDGRSWRADGMFGQLGIILPEKDTVIAVTAGHAAHSELMDAMWDVLIPAIGSIPEGSVPGEDFDRLLALSHQLSTPVPISKGQVSECMAGCGGKSYLFSVNRHSLLPLSVRYLHRFATLGLTALRLEFGQEKSVMCWSEEGTEHCIPFYTDGRFCPGQLCCGHRSYPIATCGAWIDECTLEVDIRFICTAHMSRIIMRFGANTVDCHFDEDPSVESMLRMLFDLSPPMRPVARHAARFIRQRLPGITGTAAVTVNSEPRTH